MLDEKNPRFVGPAAVAQAARFLFDSRDHGLADLEWIVPHHAHAVLIPRAEDPEQVVHVRDRVDFLRPAHLVETPVWLIPVIESARGAWRACTAGRCQ